MRLTLNIIFNRLSVIFLVSLALVSCGSMSVGDGDFPEWVQSEPDNFPNSQYLSATGSASKVEQAKARALGNLAKVFEVKINEVSISVDDVSTTRVQGVETVEKRQSIASTVNIETDKMVQGARVAEQWQNSADLTWHALAVLDRSQAGNNIRTEMRRLDEETQYSLSQYETRLDAFDRISDLQQANSLQVDRQTLQKALKVIDIQGRGSPARWNLAELRDDLDQELKKLPLKTQIRTDGIGDLRKALQGAASKSGFEPDNARSMNNYTLVGNLDSQQPIKKDNWYWMRSSLTIELLALDGSTVIGSRTWLLKVSAGDVSQLKPRMKKVVEDKLNAELLNTMLDFAS
jgi:hypothetical protein